MKILGAIIAGGVSSRMGGREKAFLELGGVPLIERVISRLTLQVASVVINANGDPERFNRFAFPVLPDLQTDIGTPLAGIQTALHHAKAKGFTVVVTVPSDSPFLPLDLVQTLLAAGKGGPIIAASNDHSHYLTGLWPVGLLPVLNKAIASKRLKRVQDFSSLVNASELVWPASLVDPFLNVNTPEDLAFAEAMLSW